MMGLETKNLPRVSIIIPCRNEEPFISMCLDSVIANDYPKDRLEVWVVDGMSVDGTWAIVEGYARRYPFIRLMDNPKKITPVAFNLGIQNARGEIIMLMSAHARLEKNYISQGVESLDKYGADNVGGVMKTLPQQGGLLGETIVLSLNHRFGVGSSYFRIHTSEPKWVDTVFGGCYKKDVFKRIGLFNENLISSQDIEFNLRLKKAGGKTLLVPDIVSYYYARSNFLSFGKNNFRNGLWAILPFLYSPIMPVSWRHLVPLTFVLGLFGSALLTLLWPFGWWMLVGITGAYAVTNLAASMQVAVKEKEIRYLFSMPIAFTSLHLAYGIGSFWGLLRVLTTRGVRFFYKRSEVKSLC